MTNARYRRKQLAKRDGWQTATTPAGQSIAQGSGSSSSSGTAAEPAVAQPNAPAAPAREER